jgi:hypothetical protein
MVSPNCSVGAILTYQQTSYTDYGLNYKQYSAAPFVRYNFDKFFLMADYNFVNVPSNPFSGNNDRVTKTRTLLGAGYFIPAGRSQLNVVASYDVQYTLPSVFSSPWVFRVFFTF